MTTLAVIFLILIIIPAPIVLFIFVCWLALYAADKKSKS